MRAQRIAGVFALLCLALAALIAGKPNFTNASRPARGLSNPVVAIEVIQNIGEVDDILSQSPSPDREAMRIKQYLDFGLLVAYGGLFVTLALLLVSSGSWGKMAGLAAGVCGVAMLAFGVIQNFAIRRVVNLPLEETTSDMMNAIRRASAAKWILSALTLAILSAYFLRDKRWGRRVVGVFMLVGGALQAYGLADNVWLERSGVAVGAALAGLVVLFFRVR